MTRRLVFPLLFLALLLSACAGAEQPGTLAGRVTIGPLQPVARAGQPDPTPGPEVFAGREVVVYDEAGAKEIARAPIQSPGVYNLSLPPGVYTVDINHLGIDFSKDLPATVTVTSGQTTELNFDIDTGIR